MSKSLSKQICEICGIEYELYYDSVEFKYVWLTKEEFENCKHKRKLILLKGEEKKEVEKDYPYPKIDFEKNNNFVKLFELKLGNSDATLSQVLVDEYPIRDKKTFLISVLTCIKRCRILSNMITTSIRKTKWEV